MNGLDLYEFIKEHTDEVRKIDGTAHTWIPILWIQEFFETVIKAAGYGYFDDGGIDIKWQGDVICVNIDDIFGYFLPYETANGYIERLLTEVG